MSCKAVVKMVAVPKAKCPECGGRLLRDFYLELVYEKARKRKGLPTPNIPNGKRRMTKRQCRRLGIKHDPASGGFYSIPPR